MKKLILLSFRRIFYGILVFMLPLNVNAQTELDSIEQKLAQTSDLKVRIGLMKDLIFRGMIHTDTEKGLEVSNAILEEASKLPDENPPRTKLTAFIGAIYAKLISVEREELLIARELCDSLIKDFDRYNWELGDKVRMLYYSGWSYDALNFHQSALDEYFKIVEIGTKDSSQLAVIYNAIGLIYKDNYDFKNAEQFFRKALELEKQYGIIDNVVLYHGNLGSVALEPDTAVYHCIEAIRLAKENDLSHTYFAESFIELGFAYLKKKKNYREALKNFQLGLEKAQLAKANNLIAITNFGIGSCLVNLNQNNNGISFLKKAYKDFEANQNDFRTREVAEVLTKVFEKEKDFEQAHQYLKIAKILGDSIYNEKSASAFSEYEIRYNSLEKDKSIAQQKFQIEQTNSAKNRMILIGFGIFMLLVFVFQRIYYKQKRKKQETEIALLEEQQESEKLRELDQIKSTFFTNISHELRTPLTLVAAPLTDAMQEVKPSPLKNTLELAHSNTQKLLRLVNEILDLSKLDAGKVEPKLAEIHLLEILRRLFYAFESIAQVRGLQLVFDTNISKDLRVNLDEEKFEKIINNLLANAIKFTEKGGTITFNAKEKNGQFQFEVADTGMGISEEELPKVFDRFYQSTAENAPLKGGTGIGLALAKELAELLNGDLKVQSKLKEGSQFILNLPLEIANSQNVISKKEEQEVIKIKKTETPAKFNFTPLLLNGEKPRILIIEDNLEMSDFLEKSLSVNYHCTKVYDGLEALEILEDQVFDLITCDVMMPNLDGFSLREKLIENEVIKQIPFVMLTARAMEQDKLKGLRLGVDDYLTKPFNLNELKARIHNLLCNKLARDNFQNEEKAVPEIPLTHKENLLKSAEEFVLKRIDDPQLRVDHLANELNLSARQLSRTMNKLIGISPVNFILEIRLQKARQLLESRQFMTVSEVRYEIGIESASYFTKKFTERFGKNPKNYLE